CALALAATLVLLLAPRNFSVVFASFLVSVVLAVHELLCHATWVSHTQRYSEWQAFELSVGLFYACAGVLRSKYIPQRLHSRVMGLFRMPLNLITIAGTFTTIHYSNR